MRVVSGIKPTGNLHLGNYLGAVKQWVAMQDAVQAQGGETMYFIADLHGLTEFIAPQELRANTIEMTATLVAAGSGRSSGTRPAFPRTASSPGCSTTSPGSAGSTA
jgi:tryptophanyl-tRNA synthetase